MNCVLLDATDEVCGTAKKLDGGGTKKLLPRKGDVGKHGNRVQVKSSIFRKIEMLKV